MDTYADDLPLCDIPEQRVGGNHLTLVNAAKSKVMIISRQRVRSTPEGCLSLLSQPLEQVQNYKYLGDLLNSSLNWSTHIHNIWSRARHTGDYILYRTFATHSNSSSLLQLYVLVHPHLEYACAMLRETLNLLEGVQKFALRVCFKQYSSSYEDLLLIYCKSTSVKVMNVS